LVWEGSDVQTFADVGGSPWGAVLGSDGSIYVTQGGNVPGSGDTSAVSGIQRVREDGSVELVCSEIDGRTLFGPNDLAFGPDGRALVATTIAEGVSIVSPDGDLVDHLELGQHATNCIFAGSTLYVTATKVAEIEASQRTGTLWAVDTDAEGPLPLLPGRL